MIYAFTHFERFIAFVIERHRIYRRRAAGSSAPWTKDEILATYKFCNVYRELDRTTMWIRDHWREPHERHIHLWFAMIVARFINLPDTLENLALPGRWNRAQFLHVMNDRKARGLRCYSGAYIVSTNGQTTDKALYLADLVFEPLWQRREALRPREHQSLRNWHETLMTANGMGSFMAAQIVADMKYVPPLTGAGDWWSFAASGPGSRKGMNYVLGREPKAKWKEHEWKEALMELSMLVRPHLERESMPRMHNQDLQNCLCEFSKYERTRLGTGRPKSNFTPHPEPEEVT